MKEIRIVYKISYCKIGLIYKDKGIDSIDRKDKKTYRKDKN